MSISLPPRISNSEISTLRLSGRVISAPPTTVKIFKSTRSAASSAAVRSSSLPPKTLTTEHEAASRHRPLRSLPLRIDRIRRGPSPPSRTGSRATPGATVAGSLAIGVAIVGGYQHIVYEALQLGAGLGADHESHAVIKLIDV